MVFFRPWSDPRELLPSPPACSLRKPDGDGQPREMIRAQPMDSVVPDRRLRQDPLPAQLMAAASARPGRQSCWPVRTDAGRPLQGRGAGRLPTDCRRLWGPSYRAGTFLGKPDIEKVSEAAGRRNQGPTCMVMGLPASHHGPASSRRWAWALPTSGTIPSHPISDRLPCWPKRPAKLAAKMAVRARPPGRERDHDQGGVFRNALTVPAGDRRLETNALVHSPPAVGAPARHRHRNSTSSIAIGPARLAGAGRPQAVGRDHYNGTFSTGAGGNSRLFEGDPFAFLFRREVHQCINRRRQDG